MSANDVDEIQNSTKFTLSGPGVELIFDCAGERLRLLQMQRQDDAPLLYTDAEGAVAGPGPLGNPLAVVVRDGQYAGVYGTEAFRVLELKHDERHLLA